MKKIQWVAVAAMVLVAALANVALSQDAGAKWFGMGSDNIMGMMPPNGMNDPGSGGRQMMPQGCGAGGPITVTQTRGRRSYTYVSTKNGCVYTIARNGAVVMTVTYDSSSGTYKITDPGGSGALLLQLGIKPGQFTSAHVRPRISR